jgi:hypothetical protein
MAGAFKNIDSPSPSPPGEYVPPPLVRGEDTLAGWRGGGGSIFWKTSDTALYSTYVSTLWCMVTAQGRLDSTQWMRCPLPDFSLKKVSTRQTHGRKKT